MVKRSRRSSHRRTKRRSVRSTRSRRHHRARHTRGRGKRTGGNPNPMYGVPRGTLFSPLTYGENSQRLTHQANSEENPWINNSRYLDH